MAPLEVATVETKMQITIYRKSSFLKPQNNNNIVFQC